jgi:probable rRNA maturation factor
MAMVVTRKAPAGARGTKSPPARLSRAAIDAFVARARKRIGLQGQVNVLLADDETLRKLNREYRGKNKTTDVLSFPAMQIAGTAISQAGDVAVSLDMAARQAAEHGHSLQTEVRILLLHGLLHLAGYDHESDSGEMRQREAELRVHFRLPTALIQRSEK